MEHTRPIVYADCRPLYPEVVAFGAPRGTRERLKDRAKQEGTSVSNLIRRAVSLVMADAAGQPRTQVEA